ncbi:hypothetical protein EGW08_003208, partial [Elysia chlorotica]
TISISAGAKRVLFYCSCDYIICLTCASLHAGVCFTISSRTWDSPATPLAPSAPSSDDAIAGSCPLPGSPIPAVNTFAPESFSFCADSGILSTSAVESESVTTMTWFGASSLSPPRGVNKLSLTTSMPDATFE